MSKLILSIDELVEFYMQNNEDIEPFKDFEIIRTQDEHGSISHSTWQDVIIEINQLKG